MRHVFLAISILLSVSGLASIVDGFYRWGMFFTDLIDIYRYWATLMFLPLEDLLRWMGFSFPDWVRDVIVVWCALGGIGVRGAVFLIDRSGEMGNRGPVYSVSDKVLFFFAGPTSVLLLPITLLYTFTLALIESSFEGPKPRYYTRRPFIVLLGMPILCLAVGFGPFILAMFIDWQFLNH